MTTADQADYTDDVAITVVDTPAPIEVNVTEQAAPVSVTFPATQDVNVKSQTVDLNVDVKSMPTTSGVQIKGQDANLNVNLAASGITPNVAVTSMPASSTVAVASVPSNMTTVPSLPLDSGVSKAYENAAFVTGSSPATHTVNADLGRNGQDGWLVNDGPGDLKFAFSVDGTTYGSDHTIKTSETFWLTHLNMNKIRITWVADCGYRIMVV